METVAKGIFDHLPMCAHEVVNSGKWSGGGIVRLDSALVRPSAADVAINFHVLKPVIEEFPDQVSLMGVCNRFIGFI